MKEFKNNLKKTWKYAKDNKYKLILFIILSLFITAFSIIGPIYSAKMVIYLTDNNLKQLLLVGLIILAIDSISDILRYITDIILNKVYYNTSKNIEIDLSKYILKINNKTLDSNSSGLFIERLTGDTSKLGDIYPTLIEYFSQLIQNIGYISAIFIVDRRVFLLIVIYMIIEFLVARKRINIRDKNQKILRKEKEKLTGFIGELVRGAKDIKMLNAEKSFTNELSKLVFDYSNKGYKTFKENGKYHSFEWLLQDLYSFLVLFLLIILLSKNSITMASALIVYNMHRYVTWMSSFVSGIGQTVKDFNLSCTRIYNIMDDKEFPKEKFGNKHINKLKGDFEFKNVEFSYDNKKQVLKDVSFKVKRNTTVGFVGKSGEGKSTIFSLLCKMYNIQKGEIFLDGININSLDKDTIRGNITIISQDPYIFNLSIKDNLKLVKENLTDEEMIEACKMACLDDYIEQLPDKYDTVVGEGGVTLSGGQRQRLAIARAFVQKTEIILFDEATSALDNETQEKINQAIKNLQKEYTILIIAHRLSTIKNCDKIFFLSKGKIVAEGKHQDLLKKSKEYNNLYEKELKK